MFRHNSVALLGNKGRRAAVESWNMHSSSTGRRGGGWMTLLISSTCLAAMRVKEVKFGSSESTSLPLHALPSAATS